MKVNLELREGKAMVYEGQRTLIAGDQMVIDLRTRAGRMAARAYALTARVDAENEREGDRLYKEIMEVVGEHDAEFS